MSIRPCIGARAALSATACALALCAATPAFAQSNVPPPPKTPPPARSATPAATSPQPSALPAPTAQRSSATPPAPARKPEVGLVDALEHVNDTRSVLFDTAVRVGTKDAEALAQAEKISKGFDAYGRVLTGAGIVEGLTRGDMAPMYEAAAEEIIDRGAAALCATSGPGAPACNIVYNTSKLTGTVTNYAVESWTGKPIGEHVFEAVESAKHRLFPDTNPANESYWEARRQEHRSRFESIRSSNDAAAAQAQADAAAAAAAQTNQGSSGGGFMDFMNGLTNILAPQGPALPGPLLGPVGAPEPAAPSGACHAGHDEKAHPGGCHGTPLGAR